MSMQSKNLVSPPVLSFAALNSAPHEFFRELPSRVSLRPKEDGAFWCCEPMMCRAWSVIRGHGR